MSENKTIKLLDEAMIMTTSTGEIIADSEADIYVHNLEMFITALLIPSAPCGGAAIGRSGRLRGLVA